MLAAREEAARGRAAHGSLRPMSLFRTEALFLTECPQKGMQSDSSAELAVLELAAGGALLRGGLSPAHPGGVGTGGSGAGKASWQCLCKSTLGHPEVECKKSSVPFGSRKCIFSVNLNTALLQSMGKNDC